MLRSHAGEADRRAQLVDQGVARKEGGGVAVGAEAEMHEVEDRRIVGQVDQIGDESVEDGSDAGPMLRLRCGLGQGEQLIGR